MVVVLLLAQAVVVAAVFLARGDFRTLPKDITGNEERAWNLIHDRLQVVEYFSVAVFAIQVLSVSLALGLSRAKARAPRRRRPRRRRRTFSDDDDDDDDDDDAEEESFSSDEDDAPRRRRRGERRPRRGLRRPLLDETPRAAGGSAARTPRSGATGGGGGSGGSGRGEHRDPWSVRVREKYGVDTSALTYDPERAAEAAAEEEEDGCEDVDDGGEGEKAREDRAEAERRRCVVM
jgi:uncharacterized membrane protein YgcG